MIRHCYFPWATMFLTSNGAITKYGHCCRINGLETPKFVNSLQDVMDLWNNDIIQGIRKGLVKGPMQIEGCRHCDEYMYSQSYHILGCSENIVKYSSYETESFNALYKKANDAYNRGDTILETAPLEIYTVHNMNCNYRCKMCDQYKKNDVYLVDNVKKIVEEIGWENLDRFGFIGGESFFSADGLDLIDFCKDSQETCVYITTNGSLISKHIDKLDKINNLLITLSIDGYGAVYESVRRASWDNLYKNVKLLKEHKDMHKNWKININSIIMNSTYKSAVDIVQLADELDATVWFSYINGGFADEDFHTCPWILDKNEFYKYITLAADKARELNQGKPEIYQKAEETLMRQFTKIESPFLTVPIS